MSIGLPESDKNPTDKNPTDKNPTPKRCRPSMITAVTIACCLIY